MKSYNLVKWEAMITGKRQGVENQELEIPKQGPSDEVVMEV